MNFFLMSSLARNVGILQYFHTCYGHLLGFSHTRPARWICAVHFVELGLRRQGVVEATKALCD